MGFRSNGMKSTRRRTAMVGIAIALATLTAAALPGSDAFAGKPATGNPKKPVVSDTNGAGIPTELRGETTNSNACAGVYCHTYLAIMVRPAGTSTYKIYDGWTKISSLTGVQYVWADTLEGTNSYKTTVHDFVTVFTPGGCGGSSRVFYGVTYTRFQCGPGPITTYRKIYSSSTALTLTIPD